MTRREVVVTADAPKIERVNAKIGTLERRLEWLDQRIAEFERSPETGRRLNYDKAEREAIATAIRAMRMHHAKLEPETDPVLTLDELQQAVRDFMREASSFGLVPTVAVGERLIGAMKRSERVLAEFDDD